MVQRQRANHAQLVLGQHRPVDLPGDLALDRVDVPGVVGRGATTLAGGDLEDRAVVVEEPPGVAVGLVPAVGVGVAGVEVKVDVPGAEARARGRSHVQVARGGGV